MKIKLESTGNYLKLTHTNTNDVVVNQSFYPKLYTCIIKNYALSAFDSSVFDADRAKATKGYNNAVSKANTEYQRSRTDLTNRITESRDEKKRAELLDELANLKEKHGVEIADLTAQYNEEIDNINKSEQEAIREHTPQVSDFVLINSVSDETLTMTKAQFEAGDIMPIKGDAFTIETFERFILSSTAGEASTAPPMFGELPTMESPVFEVRNVG